MTLFGAASPQSLPIRVLIVEDQRMMADLLSARLDGITGIAVAGSVGTADEAVRMAQDLEPAVILMDYALPDATGAQATARIRALAETSAVIVISAASERDAVETSILSGAVAYLPKSDPVEVLIDAIHRAAAGELLLPGVVLRQVVIDAYRRWGEPLPGLSVSEKRTVELARAGLDPVAIGTRLGLDPRQVRDEWLSVMEKLS